VICKKYQASSWKKCTFVTVILFKELLSIFWNVGEKSRKKFTPAEMSLRVCMSKFLGTSSVTNEKNKKKKKNLQT